MKLLPIFASLLAALPYSSEGEPGNWKKISDGATLTVYERRHEGSSLHEFKAVGVVEFEPKVVKRVLEDVDEYPQFLPYVAEARELSRNGATRVGYQRISAPLVGDRDYTVRVRYDANQTKNGESIRYRWETANEVGPPEKPGVVRVKISEGSWLLQPTPNGQRTLATYCILSDGGGALPAFISNWASRTAIPKLFASIRKQAALEKYHKVER